jgi:hypothetical protein
MMSTLPCVVILVDIPVPDGVILVIWFVVLC